VAVLDVEGGKELRRSLKAAGDDLADLKEAHAEAARTVATAAKGTAPVRTGRLAASIRGSGTKTGAIVRAGGARVPYAAIQEFGWPRHNIVGQPYLVPAARETEPDWRRAYEAAVKRILAKVKGV
jgi:phage gpG-like protein